MNKPQRKIPYQPKPKTGDKTKKNQSSFCSLLLMTLMLFFNQNGFCQTVEDYTLSGYVRDAETGEELINATVSVEGLSIGVVTNLYGYYSITLSEGSYTFTYSYLGFQDTKKTIEFIENKTLDIELATASQMIEELIVTAESQAENVEEVGMSRVDIDIQAVKKMPALLGEVDLIKSLQFLPGVATVGEGTSGFYVRGGNVDQNLILLDEAPVYNASHLLGFFSVFNPDAIKDIQFYKGAMPAEYGGRLSSVVDIRMKEGNSKKFGGSAGIGTISSRLTLEAPIGKNGSFMVAGRRTYADLFLKLSSNPDVKNNRLYFYDLNAKFNYRLGDKDRIFLSAYTGRDVLADDGFSIDWGNKTGTFRWNHLFSQKLFSNLTMFVTDYDYNLGFPDGIDAFEWKSNLNDFGFKYDLGAYLNPRNTLKFGVHSTLHKIKPGNAQGLGESIIGEFNLEENQSLENAAYVSHEYKLNERIKFNYGLRFSSLHNMGPQTVYNYDDQFELIDTTAESKGFFNSFYNFEPRFGLRYTLNSESSLKLSYNRTAQYIHLASNTTSATPLDVWFMSSPNVKPQLADQLALGYFHNLKDNTIEASVELYYKKFRNSIDFKDHAQLLLNKELEGELRFGEARSYGLEVLLQKNTGRFTGWISYTLARTEKKIEEINEGNWYKSKYDKVHDFAIIASYKLTDRIDLSANWIYQTGNAVTFPTGKYEQYGRTIPVYSERNGERMPAYHRLDLASTFHLKNKLFKKAEQNLVLSVYNAYGRKNAFSINFKDSETEPGVTVAEKTYLFSFIPSLTYNVKF